MKYPIGDRVLVRTRTSGVSIGVLKEVDTENGMTVRLKNGVRIWSWSDAFTCSELATKGGKCRVAQHPRQVVIVAPEGGEILPVSDEAWEFVKANWSEGAQ